MSRHAFDDFSFLPTVDSTDEEGVVPGQAAPHPPEPESHEALHEEVAEQTAAEEMVYEEEAVPPEPPVFVQEAMSDMPVSEAEQHAEHPSAEGEEFSEDRHPELEPASAEVQPQEVTDLPKLEDDVSHAPKTELPGAAPKEKQSKDLPSGELARSDEVPSDKTREGEEPGAAKDPKPFIAPKPPPEEPLDPEQAKKQRWQKLADKIGLKTLGMSFGVHLFLLLIAAFIGVSQVMDNQVDFLPGGSSAQSQAAAAELTHKIQAKKNPWLKAKPVQRKITVQTLSSNIVMPEMAPMDMMDFSKINDRMDLSKAPSMGASQPMGLGGAGGGFGAGIGRGGKFSFVGQTAFGSKVVFVVDLSSSMSQPLKGDGPRTTRFELLKKELIKAVKQIPYGTAYQVLYFSDFAWPHNQVDSRNEEALEKYHWEIKPEEYKQAKIPAFKYIQATQFTLQDSVDIIQRSDNNRIYTNWGAGLLMALNANPKPDVIFFMTDGERKDEQGWIDIVTNENKKKLPMSVIHTSVMAQVDAAFEIDALAKRNNGSFTVVTDDGRVIKGEEYFKMK